MSKNASPIDVFPLSIATGQAFCNRFSETDRLKVCIEHRRPVLLASPRRYGKTSLALHAIQQTKIPYAQIDLFSAVDEQDIERSILRGVGKLISRMESIPKRALALASDIFGGTHIRAVLSNVELEIEINRRQEKPAYHVLDILERLERLAEKTDKKIILFFDEFQCIGEITPNHAMESVLRQVAQLTKSISFIFSGSNRHLLHELFNDRNRPFYKLCERITLDRISEEAYTIHIQKAALRTWKEKLPQRVLECLFNYSERHPYYLNLLCSRLLLGKKIPSPELIEQIWRQYVMEERSSVASELELLSKNQRKLLTVLARTDGTGAPLGREFIQQANMSKATIDQSLTFLEKRDYVFKDEKNHVHVLDPLIKTVLSGNSYGQE
jgi:AAA+ ATPase superfamily predicted ATPase